MIRQIIQAPDPRLKDSATSLGPQCVDMLAVVEDLVDTFKVTANCVGLAAPQLGHPWCAIIVDVTRRRSETYIMVNPIIVKASKDLQRVHDGCMSVAHGHRRAYTYRPKRITVKWIDVSGAEYQQKFNGLIAAVIHHEIDHLEGILFLHRLVDKPTQVLF